MKITGILSSVSMIFLVCVTFLSPLAHGQTTAPGAGKPAKGGSGGEWNFTVAPYMWAGSMHGKVTVGDYSTSSSMSFSDIMKNLQVGGLMHMEARKGRFGFFADPIYLKMIGTAPGRPLLTCTGAAATGTCTAASTRAGPKTPPAPWILRTR